MVHILLHFYVAQIHFWVEVTLLILRRLLRFSLKTCTGVRLLGISVLALYLFSEKNKDGNILIDPSSYAIKLLIAYVANTCFLYQ